MPEGPSNAVVDASVLLSVLNRDEEKHEESRELVEDAEDGRVALWAPMVVLVEVLRWSRDADPADSEAARKLDDWLGGDWLNLVEVDRRMAHVARDVIRTTRVQHGNDGLYVATAVIVGAPVVYATDATLATVAYEGVVGAEPPGSPLPRLDFDSAQD